MGFLRSIFRKKEEEDVSDAKKHATIVERRKHRRSTINESTFLYPKNRPPIQVRIIDISLGGVKLEVRESLKIDSRVELALYSGGIVSKTLIVIKWELRPPSGGYIYGAEFAGNDPKQHAFIMQYMKLITK